MRSFLAVWRRELLWMRHEWPGYVLLALAPICFMLVTVFVYSRQKVIGVPVLIVDGDHSQLSRDITRAILANETFTLAGYADSPNDFTTWAAQGRAVVCFNIPYGFERDVRGRHRARIEALVDYSNYLLGSVAVSNYSSVLASYSVSVNMKTLEALHGVAGSTALHEVMPIEYSQRMWFNPAFNSNYFNFMTTTFVFVPLQLIALLVAIRSGSSEYKMRSDTPLPPCGVWAMIMGKTAAHLTLSTPVMAATLLMPRIFGGAPFAVGSISLWIALFWFATNMALVGFGLSSLMADSIMATELCAILTLPNFLLSGATWPVFAMPKIMWLLAYGFPMNSLAAIVKKLAVLQGSLSDCHTQIIAMSCWSIVSLCCAWLGARRLMSSQRLMAASNE